MKIPCLKSKIHPMKMKNPLLFKTQPAAGKNMSIVGSTFSHENEVITLFLWMSFLICMWLIDNFKFSASSQSTVLHYHQILQIDCVKMCEDTINGSTLIYLQIQLFEICASSVLAWYLHLICFNRFNFRDLSNILTYLDDFATLWIFPEISEISKFFKYLFVFFYWCAGFLLMRLVVVKRGFTCFSCRLDFYGN